MAEESARIAQRCEEAKETKVLKLDGCGLRKFPDAVFFILRGVEITSVSLAGNALKKLTPKLAQNFTSLTALDLSSNQLSELPDSLPALNHLTQLNLSSNQFDSIPAVLPSLPNLRHLNLASNQVTSMSTEELDALAKLETIDLSHNPLRGDTITTHPRINITLAAQE